MKKQGIDRGDYTGTGKDIKSASFLVKIKYNQNCTMQGYISWLEQKKTVCFRSMMELMLLLKEASDNTEYRTWDGDEGVISEVQKLGNISEL